MTRQSKTSDLCDACDGAEACTRAAEVGFDRVPYRGAAQALQDLLGGQIDVVFASLPSVAGQIRTGVLQPIAVTSARRSPTFPDVPTVGESGLPGLDVNPWFGLMGPGKMPAEFAAVLRSDVEKWGTLVGISGARVDRSRNGAGRWKVGCDPGVR